MTSSASPRYMRPLLILSLVTFCLFAGYLIYAFIFERRHAPPHLSMRTRPETHRGQIFMPQLHERPVKFGRSGSKTFLRPSTPQTPFKYYDPTILLWDFHKSFWPSNPSLRPAEADMHEVASGNYIMKQKSYPSGDKPKYATPTKKNVSFAIIFGGYVGEGGMQDLLLGAIKTFRDKTKGNWMGSIILVTDRPNFVRKLFKENREWLQCDPKSYDDIPSRYLVPGDNEPVDDGANDCRISILYVPSERNHPLKYKWTKSKMIKILEEENRERAKDGIPILEYIFYRDADMYSWGDIQKVIDYLAENYRGEDALLWPQPGASLQRRGEILHGGIWMLHREISTYWLKEWSTLMTMTKLGRQGRDQVSLGMLAFANKWPHKLSNEERRQKDLSIDMHLMAFDEIYPLEMINEAEWKQGLFLHWTGRHSYPKDKAAFEWCNKQIEINKVKHLDYKGEDDSAPEFDVDHSGVHLRDEWGNPMDVVIPVSKVDCLTKQTVMHAYHNLRPRRIFIFVPDIAMCGEAFYFAPNIFCFTYGASLSFEYLREGGLKSIVGVFGGETSILRRLVVPLHISLVDSDLSPSFTWPNQMLTEKFVLLEEGTIMLGSDEEVYDAESYATFLREVNPEEAHFLRHSLGDQAPKHISVGLTVIDKNHVRNMVRQIAEVHKFKKFSIQQYVRMLAKWHDENPGKTLPNNPMGALYSGYMIQEGIEPNTADYFLWKNVSHSSDNSANMDIGKTLSGRCLTKSFLERLYQEGIGMVKVIRWEGGEAN